MADEETGDEDAKKGADPVAPAAGEKKPLFKRLLPFIAGGTLSIGLGLGAGVLQNRRHEAKPGDESGEKKPANPDEFPTEVKLDLGKTIFNCADNGQVIAGAVTIELEVRTTEKWGAGEKPMLKEAIDPKAPEARFSGRIRDSLNMLLSTKMSADLRSSRGKEVLKLEILDQMNRILFGGMNKDKDPQGVVTKVLFTEFLVQ